MAQSFLFLIVQYRFVLYYLIIQKINKDQKNPLNITSVGENIFYHCIHFLKGRGWTEESLLDSIRGHYHLYDKEPEPEESKPEAESPTK